MALMPSLQYDRMCQDKVISSVPGILMKITKRSEVRGAESSWHSPKAYKEIFVSIEDLNKIFGSVGRFFFP